MIVTATMDSFEKEVFEAEQKTVLLDFYADWCAPCKQQEPVLQSLEEQPDLKIVKVSVDACPDIADAFHLHAVPSLYVLQEGKVVSRAGGFQSREEILAMLFQCGAVL